MAISRNPPAFPNETAIQLGDDYQGMTLRDYFAAAALQGLLAGRDILMEAEWLAAEAYQLADAMIAEREKRDAKD